MAAKSVPLKRRNPNNPQIRSYTEAVRRGRNTYHVFREDQGWKVKKIGARSEGVFDTKNDAIHYAKRNASDKNGEVLIHSRDGLIQERHSYGSDPHPPRD